MIFCRSVALAWLIASHDASVSETPKPTMVWRWLLVTVIFADLVLDPTSVPVVG
jgi:hypothetical protein